MPESVTLTAVHQGKFTTRRVVEQVKRLADQRGWTRIALVTHTLRSARARAIFTKSRSSYGWSFRSRKPH